MQSKRAVVAKNGIKKTAKTFFFVMALQRGFLLGKHGFTKQSISAKAYISAGFKKMNIFYC